MPTTNQGDVMFAVTGALDDPITFVGILLSTIRKVSPCDQGPLFADRDGWNDLK